MMKPGTIPCPRCGHRQILSGELVNFPHHSPRLLFQTQIPLKNFVHRLFGKKLSIWVRESQYLCVDCGLVWSNVDPRLVQDEIQAQQNDSPSRPVHLASRPVMADDELDGPC